MSTPTPSKEAIADLLSFLQQHDYETAAACYNPTPQDEARAKAHMVALEARYERIAAGAPKPGDLAKMRAFVRGWFDQGAAEDAGWEALEAWVYGRQVA